MYIYILYIHMSRLYNIIQYIDMNVYAHNILHICTYAFIDNILVYASILSDYAISFPLEWLHEPSFMVCQGEMFGFTRAL